MAWNGTDRNRGGVPKIRPRPADPAQRFLPSVAGVRLSHGVPVLFFYIKNVLCRIRTRLGVVATRNHIRGRGYEITQTIGVARFNSYSLTLNSTFLI